jgi:hypothetical protein
MKKFAVFCILFLSAQLRAQTFFRDIDLHAWQLGHPLSIVFGWSYLMPLSVMGREEISEVAKNLGIDLITLQDNSCLKLENCHTTNDSILDSEILWDLGVFDHFPFIVIIKDGLIYPTIIHGYETKESLVEIIQSIIKKD